jgi:hypothetical protein
VRTVLWEELERIGCWQREHLPTIDTRPGMALLIWLLTNDRQPTPIGELYTILLCMILILSGTPPWLEIGCPALG